MLKQDVPEVSGKKVLVMFLKCISYPYRKFPSFTEKGTWYFLKSSGLRVATTTLPLLWPMWLESIIRIFSGLEMKKDYFIIFFFVFTPSITLTLFIPPHTSPSLPIMNRNNVSGP